MQRPWEVHSSQLGDVLLKFQVYFKLLIESYYVKYNKFSIIHIKFTRKIGTIHFTLL